MIEIKKVSKRFDKIEAVSDVSLSIEEGQVFGLLGTNGVFFPKCDTVRYGSVL